MLRSFYHYSFSGYCRYPDDIYDRYWYPEGSNSTFLNSTTPPPQILTTNHTIDQSKISLVIPEAVIDTALTTTGGNITIIFPFPEDYIYDPVVIFYYAELDATANATSRQFYLQAPQFPTTLINPFVNASQFSVNEWYFNDFFYLGWEIVLYQTQTIHSPLGPLVNALEVLEISENLMNILTNQEDGELLFCLLSTGFRLLFKFSSENTLRHSTPRVSFLQLG